jgi:hypothetical protein
MPNGIRQLFLIFSICANSLQAYAQKKDTIYLRKQNAGFFFFQKGKVCDTIVAGRSDHFYLILSDSIKQNFMIETENAQINPSLNDSLVVIKYLPGIRYLNKFVKDEKENDLLLGAKDKNQISKLIMLTLINGASEMPLQKIKISFSNKISYELLAEFFYFAK